MVVKMVFSMKKIMTIGIIILLIGVFNTSEGKTIFVDSTPPVTTCSLDPPTPNGLNGYYVSNVAATLNATDGSGVNVTYYRIYEGEWQIYNNPFVLSEDGNDVLIEFYSIDNIGNIEEIKSTSIDIDKTPPNVTIEWDLGGYNGQLLITFTVICSDETSGMDRVEMYINDGLWATVEGAGPEYVFEMKWSNAFKNVIFKFILYDHAGWSAQLEFITIKGLIFGAIKNLKKFGPPLSNNIIIFNSVNLNVFEFYPFSYTKYKNGEKFASTFPIFKIVTNKFIFGFFTMFFGKVIIT